MADDTHHQTVFTTGPSDFSTHKTTYLLSALFIFTFTKDCTTVDHHTAVTEPLSVYGAIFFIYSSIYLSHSSFSLHYCNTVGDAVNYFHTQPSFPYVCSATFLLIYVIPFFILHLLFYLILYILFLVLS